MSYDQIQIAGDTLTNWVSSSRVFAAREMAIDLTNGVLYYSPADNTPWSGMVAFAGGGGSFADISYVDNGDGTYTLTYDSAFTFGTPSGGVISCTATSPGSAVDNGNGIDTLSG